MGSFFENFRFNGNKKETGSTNKPNIEEPQMKIEPANEQTAKESSVIIDEHGIASIATADTLPPGSKRINMPGYNFLKEGAGVNVTTDFDGYGRRVWIMTFDKIKFSTNPADKEKLNHLLNLAENEGWEKTDGSSFMVLEKIEDRIEQDPTGVILH